MERDQIVDVEKRMMCINKNIRLVEIDYKWDGSETAIRNCIGVM